MKTFIKLLVLALLLLLILAYGFYIYIAESRFNSYETSQINLAKNLGVQINDYPYPKRFPEGYYKSILSSKSTLQDVHKAISGYKKVYQCGKLAEIYYYYSGSDREALRFQIIYNEELHFETLQGEDEDSRYLNPYGCAEGRIAEGRIKEGN